MRFVPAVALAVLGSVSNLLAQTPTTQLLASTSPITLEFHDAEPGVAYEQLAAEMHLTLDRFSAQAWRGSDDVKISASFNHTPFWEAFTQLAEKTSAVPAWWE